MQLTPVDWAVVALYFLFNLAIGFYYKSRAGSSVDEFFLSGRNVPWWLAGTSMVATTFAADTPLAVTGMVAVRRHRRELAVVVLCRQRHADRLFLRASVAPLRRHDRYRIFRNPLLRQACGFLARLPGALSGNPDQLHLFWAGSTRRWSTF